METKCILENMCKITRPLVVTQVKSKATQQSSNVAQAFTGRLTLHILSQSSIMFLQDVCPKRNCTCLEPLFSKKVQSGTQCVATYYLSFVC